MHSAGRQAWQLQQQEGRQGATQGASNQRLEALVCLQGSRAPWEAVAVQGVVVAQVPSDQLQGQAALSLQEAAASQGALGRGWGQGQGHACPSSQCRGHQQLLSHQRQPPSQRQGSQQ